MKHPIFCLLIVFALVVSTASPLTILNAAELWNSQNGSSTGGKKAYYYNQSNKSGSKQGITLYNKQGGHNKGISLSGGGMKSTLEGYKSVKMTGQHKSKLWGFMSESAVANRQADIDNALQIEYQTQKHNAKEMLKVISDARTYQMKGQKKHQNELGEYYAKKEQEEAEKAKKKQAALNGHSYKAPPTAYTSKGMAQTSSSKTVYKTSSSSDTESNEVRVELKKAPKLFNTPDR